MNSIPETFAVDDVRESDSITVTAFVNHHDYLEMEFQRLDCLLSAYTREFRNKMNQMRKLITASEVYISDAEVDFLLGDMASSEESPCFDDGWVVHAAQMEEVINRRLESTLQLGTSMPLPRLCQIFKLSTYELQLIILCLAPELDSKYDTIYAYLQDDITRKRPSLDLALNLFSQQGIHKWSLRSFINENSPVFRAGLIHLADDTSSPSGNSNLAKMLKLDDRILSYLLQDTHTGTFQKTIYNRQSPRHKFSTVAVEDSVCEEVKSAVDHHLQQSATVRKNLIINLHGNQFAEQLELVHAVCDHLETHFLQMDLARLAEDPTIRQQQIHNCLKEGLLQQAPLALLNADKIPGSDRSERDGYYRSIDEYGWLTFILSEKPCLDEQALRYHAIDCIAIFVPPISSSRQRLWWRHCNQLYGAGLGADHIEHVTSRFNMNSLQIESLVKSIALHTGINHRDADIKLVEQLCRSESNQSLSEMAEKVSTCYGWKDIILPKKINNYLHTICNQVRCQFRVFDEWGFAGKSNFSKGISALFSGPPGTGKTMAAQIVANELGLDLYKINLANVVSKYIGETEKNLEKIFRAAEFSNAILLFDECDAIFGKRTEVSDSHDRYANIEVSFLLQKMDEYRGIVLLTTNLKKNIDEAFVRRIRFILEFPFPDKESREEIWRCHFPPKAPLSDAVDFSELAEKFSVSGGNIKNVVLNAAFLAADTGDTISLDHIMESARREYEKIGKLTYQFKE